VADLRRGLTQEHPAQPVALGSGVSILSNAVAPVREHPADDGVF
jgi:hypothetical protein